MTRDELFNLICEYFEEEIEEAENIREYYPHDYNDCLNKLFNDLKTWHIQKFGSTRRGDRTVDHKPYPISEEEYNELTEDIDDFILIDLEELGLV